jgi:hypothetical protein
MTESIKEFRENQEKKYNAERAAFFQTEPKTQTQKAVEIIKSFYSKSDVLEIHQAENFDAVIRTLRNQGLNDLDSSMFIIARDAIQNIVLENYEVVNNQIVEKGKPLTREQKVEIQKGKTASAKKEMQIAVKEFTHTASASNYRLLEKAMLVYQTEKNRLEDCLFRLKKGYPVNI